MRTSWTLSFSIVTDLFFLQQLRTFLEITCILCISLDPYEYVFSFHSSPILSRNLGEFAGAYYIVEFVMTYSAIWIIFLNVRIVIVYDFSTYVKQTAHVNTSNFFCYCTLYIATTNSILIMGFNLEN